MRVVQADGLWFAIAKILASLGCAMAWSLPSLMIARALQGLGASAVMAANVALIRFIYPSDKLGRGIGLNALVVSSLSNTAAVAGLASQHLNSAIIAAGTSEM
jgi:MFS family permease